MKDLIGLMPHSKTESKMRRGDSLFSANEMAEMKNCNKCFLFEGRKKRDLYFWMADVGRGPSAKFQVENVHTAGNEDDVKESVVDSLLGGDEHQDIVGRV